VMYQGIDDNGNVQARQGFSRAACVVQ